MFTVSRRRRIALLVTLIAFLSGMPAFAQYAFDTQEAAFDQTYDATTIELRGSVVDELGEPIADADISLIAWGANSANNGASVIAAADGTFSLSGLMRRAALLRVERSGFYTEIRAVNLQRDLGESAVDVGEVMLWAERRGRARLMFAGDTMFGRRFFSSGLIQPGTYTQDTEAILAFMNPILQIADHTSVNLECPVTDNPATPHPTKEYVFYSRPESVDVLATVGVDSVNMGNNHFYDYLEDGAADTMAEVSAAGLAWFGAGVDETDAKQNRYYTSIHQIDFAFQGFSEIVGYSYGSNPLHIIAEDVPAPKGGALWATPANVAEFVTQEVRNARFTIPILHGGTEYTYLQTPAMRDMFKVALERDAGIVVAHHPHFVHGIGVYDRGSGPRFILGSLGNFVFDQDTYETFRSYLAVVDIDTTANGVEVVRIELIPFRLDGYIPRPLVGTGLDRMGRYLGHLSTAENAIGDGIAGATVFAEDGRILVFADPGDVYTDDEIDSRALTLDNRRTGTFEFSPRSAGDSLAHLRTGAPAGCEVGRDLLAIGDFEDDDVDADFDEGDRWMDSSIHYTENSEVYRGRAAMVLMRRDVSTIASTVSMSSTVLVEPGSNLSLTGYFKAENGGDFEIEVRWSTGGSFSWATPLLLQPAGTFDWQPFSVDLTVPPDATALKVYYRQHPPVANGEGYVFLDDLALVEWDEQTLDGEKGVSFAVPNDWSYIRCEAASAAQELGVELTHRIHTSEYRSIRRPRECTGPVGPEIPSEGDSDPVCTEP